MFVVTTRVTLSEPDTVTEDKRGDTDTTWTPESAPIDAHLAEKSKQVFDGASQRWNSVRFHRLICPPGTALGQGIRVTDTADGLVYLVRYVYETAKTSPIGYEMVRADLDRVD